MEFAIFANGIIFPHSVDLHELTKIIAADGGAQHCLSLGISPNVLIGDLDSITLETLTLLKSEGVEIVRHPENKNETDLQLAIDYAKHLGATKIKLYGILGGRWDMSFANIMLLASPQYSQIDFHVIGDDVEIFILRGGKSISVVGKPGDTISVLPLGGNARGVTYKGLAWALVNTQLDVGSPLGVSNYMIGNEATIQLITGTLLIFHSPKE